MAKRTSRTSHRPCACGYRVRDPTIRCANDLGNAPQRGRQWRWRRQGKYRMFDTCEPDDCAAGEESSSTTSHDEWSEEGSGEHGPQVVDVALVGEGEGDQDNGSRKNREQTKDNEVNDNEIAMNDGDIKDSRHTWNFCQGNLSVLLWNDMMQTMTGGDGIVDIVIPDTGVGFGSSVSGGPGNMPTVLKGKSKRECGVTSNPKVQGGSGRKRRKKDKNKIEDAFLSVLESARSDMDNKRSRRLELEELVDDARGL